MTRHATQLYLGHLGLAVVGLAAVGTGAYFVAASLSADLPSTSAISRACREWLSAAGLSTVLALGVAALALGVVARGARATARHLKATQRALSGLPVLAHRRLGGVEHRVIASAQRQAFCAGYLRPHIYLTTGALEELTADELRAVLAHEEHHRRRRDPLRRLVAATLAEGLFFLPVLGHSSARFASLGELAADRAAVQALRDHRHLASAMLKLTEGASPSEAVVALAPERVDHLLGREVTPWRVPWALAGASAAVLAALGAIVLLFQQGVVDPTPRLPFLIAFSCMLAMIVGPAVLASTAAVFSWRAWRTRRRALRGD